MLGRRPRNQVAYSKEEQTKLSQAVKSSTSAVALVWRRELKCFRMVEKKKVPLEVN